MGERVECEGSNALEGERLYPVFSSRIADHVKLELRSKIENRSSMRRALEFLSWTALIHSLRCIFFFYRRQFWRLIHSFFNKDHGEPHGVF